MGWTTYHVDPWNGKIDRKAECDRVYAGENERTIWKVLKSAMNGSTYYAAVERTDKETGESYVFGAVCLTSVDNSNYHENFGYKDMDESMGPAQSKCPNSILDLLSETENEWALAWRKRCREYNANKNRLGKLPIGTVIEFELNGNTCKADKRAAAYQFKTPFWMSVCTNHYFPKKIIPGNFRIVS